MYRDNIKEYKRLSSQTVPSEVKKIAESPIIQANKHGVDITRDMKIKEIVDIMQARYDSLNEKYNHPSSKRYGQREANSKTNERCHLFIDHGGTCYKAL